MEERTVEERAVAPYHFFPLVVMLVAMPSAAVAQFGDSPGMPGGAGTGFGNPPHAPPAQCQALLTISKELQKHGAAIEAANNNKADMKTACRLFRTYIATEAKMIKMLDADGPSCGARPQVNRQVRESHAKAQQIGKQVCDAAARGPGLRGLSLLGSSLEDPSPREKPWPAGDYWLPGEPFYRR